MLHSALKYCLFVLIIYHDFWAYGIAKHQTVISVFEYCRLRGITEYSNTWAHFQISGSNGRSTVFGLSHIDQKVVR